MAAPNYILADENPNAAISAFGQTVIPPFAALDGYQVNPAPTSGQQAGNVNPINFSEGDLGTGLVFSATYQRAGEPLWMVVSQGDPFSGDTQSFTVTVTADGVIIYQRMTVGTQTSVTSVYVPVGTQELVFTASLDSFDEWVLKVQS